MHEHYDVENNLTGTTVVTRESLWDDASRARAFRLFEYDKSIDSETGLPIEDAYRDQPFLVEHRTVNYAARAIARKRAEHAEDHKDDDHWFEGRRYFAQVPTEEQMADFAAKQQARQQAP